MVTIPLLVLVTNFVAAYAIQQTHYHGPRLKGVVKPAELSAPKRYYHTNGLPSLSRSQRFMYTRRSINLPSNRRTLTNRSINIPVDLLPKIHSGVVNIHAATPTPIANHTYNLLNKNLFAKRSLRDPKDYQTNWYEPNKDQRPINIKTDKLTNIFNIGISFPNDPLKPFYREWIPNRAPNSVNIESDYLTDATDVRTLHKKQWDFPKIQDDWSVPEYQFFREQASYPPEFRASMYVDQPSVPGVPGSVPSGPTTAVSPTSTRGWRTRVPRVIFPQNNAEFIAFRDKPDDEWLLQNDVNLQDLSTTNPGVITAGSPDAVEVFLHSHKRLSQSHAINTCVQSGGSCENFFSCWLGGGLLDGDCAGGLALQGCCFRGNKQRRAVGTQDAPFSSANSLIYEPSIDFAKCGISPAKQTAQRRIVGGDEAGFGSFPWQAYIRIGSSRCGGSLVSRRHVVTAGHCVARASPRQVHVTLGDYVINSAVEPLPAYTFGVSSIQVHPYFKFTPQADRYDIAVLRLDRPAHSLPHISPICLPATGEDFLGQVGVAAGWGALTPGSRLRPQTLQSVPVPVLDNRVCERWHRANGINVVIYDEMLCAGYKQGGRDSCQGDSGGPLMLQKNGRWFLIGIVSAGYSCAQPGQPGIYHRISYTVSWLTRAISNNLL